MTETETKTTEPEVGMGATLVMWTDRHPYTIVEVVRFKSGQRAGEVKGVFATRDDAVRTDSNGMSESQTYEFTTNPDAHREWFHKDKHGAFRSEGGTRLAVGVRGKYFDFSF